MKGKLWVLIDEIVFEAGYHYERIQSWDSWGKLRLPERVVNRFKEGQVQYHRAVLHANMDNGLAELRDLGLAFKGEPWPPPSAGQE